MRFLALPQSGDHSMIFPMQQKCFRSKAVFFTSVNLRDQKTHSMKLKKTTYSHNDLIVLTDILTFPSVSWKNRKLFPRNPKFLKKNALSHFCLKTYIIFIKKAHLSKISKFCYKNAVLCYYKVRMYRQWSGKIVYNMADCGIRSRYLWAT